jgi:thiol:disulfide interchange protein
MKKLFILLSPFLITPFIVQAQILNPVHWNFSSQKINDSVYALHFKASIDPGWHIYAQDAGEGPIPTSFKFDTAAGVVLVGKVKGEGNLINKYDNAFGSNLKYYEQAVDFVQQVRLTNIPAANVKGTLEFMVCNDKNCLPPKDIPFTLTIGNVATSAAKAAEAATAAANNAAAVTKNVTAITSAIAADNASNKSLWWIFLACFGGGFIALITPCVFSMIPITVSYFTKQSENRSAGIKNAIVYSLSIIIIYTLLGFLVSKIFGAAALNNLASNIWVNLIFFVIFIVFALSFLGAFDINLPSSWANRTDSKAGLGNLAGIFFMALTLAIVSFSCTGPIIGNLLVLAARGGYAGPLIGMFGFSLAVAIPFSLFAIFPSWLNKLGKAGGWLNAVKVTLGFIELALAFKFLSNVDMAYHWNILSKEVFLAIWIVIFTMTGFYLLGKLKLSHDSDLSHISLPRLFFAIVSFAFVVYLLPGMFGGQLKGIMSGFLPNYSSIVFENNSGTTNTGSQQILPQKYISIFAKATPPGYLAFYDYDEALAAARAEKKPLMIDFTGWSCVNCRKMENAVWTNPEVKKLINQDFILVSLYVDDRTRLPDSQQYISKFDGSKIKTIGEKNADFEEEVFNRNSQPYYVFLDGNQKMLGDKGYAFDDNPQHFIDFLQAVKAAYNKQNP